MNVLIRLCRVCHILAQRDFPASFYLEGGNACQRGFFARALSPLTMAGWIGITAPAMNLAPIFPQRRADPISEPGWAAELKLDGFRGLPDTINGRILSKNLNPLKRFQHLLDAIYSAASAY